MAEKYMHEYNDNNMYGHVVDLLASQGVADGVHLDIGCGYAAIREGIQRRDLQNVNYVGLDGNSQTVAWLAENGVEAHHRVFGQWEEDLTFVKQVLAGRRLVSVSILDMLEHLDGHTREGVMQMLHSLVEDSGALLVISVPNITHKDISLKLMEGRFDYTEEGLLDDTHLHLFTAESLEALTKAHGFDQVDSRDVNWELTEQDFPAQSTFLAKGALLSQYLRYIKESFDPHHNTYQHVRLYRSRSNILPKTDVEQAAVENKNPFLSVITRTQGKRHDALTEVLLCLTGQSDTDFEVLLMGHNVAGDQLDGVRGIIEDLPAWMRKKVRYIPVDGGTRTTPLNVGFGQARGEYISILDDDDLVFDNWVETFHGLAKEAPGAILHSFCVAQEWMTVGSEEPVALRAAGSPNSRYCVSFNLLSQLVDNSCPTLSYAIPRYAFQQLGIQFDEQLTTTEDWDFLMRTSFICGVADRETTTSIYRLWQNYENSAILHSQEEWNANRKYLLDRFNQHPILLPQGYVERIVKLWLPPETGTDKNSLLRRTILYVDAGYGFSEQLRLFPSLIEAQPTAKIHFWDMEKPAAGIQFPDIAKLDTVGAIRFDPAKAGPLTLQNLSIQVVKEDGVVNEYSVDNIFSNGYRENDVLYYLKDDPQIIITFEQPIKVVDVRVFLDLEARVSDERIEALFAPPPPPPAPPPKSLASRARGRISRLARGTKE